MAAPARRRRGTPPPAQDAAAVELLLRVFPTVMAVAASALRAQQARMRIIAENIANADSTARTPGGDPYRRSMPIFEPQSVEGGGRGQSPLHGGAK